MYEAPSGTKMYQVLGNAIPEVIDGYKEVRPYRGESGLDSVETFAVQRRIRTNFRRDKVKESLAELFESIELRDGMTLSFHHHLRNGDYVLNAVMEHVAKSGVKDLTIAASTLFPVHAPLVEHIKSGVVSRIYCGGMSGPVADAVSRGELKHPAVLQTHGGRPRAIQAGEIHIDVAFIAASECDAMGNMNGKNGPSAFGVMGYPCVDAEYADLVVAVTDNLVPYPACPIAITEEDVDYVVKMDKIGDPAGIVSGTLRVTENPTALGIAETAANIVEASGILKDGFSFQTGAGGTSLAVAMFIKDKMKKAGIKGSFLVGGTTKYIVDLFKEGLFNSILDVQCFDAAAIESVYTNPRHQPMSAGMYANPWNKGAVVNGLDVMILGATEVDTSFNVNVITNSEGRIISGSGGHSDTAAGSKLTVIVTPLVRKKYPIVRRRVTTITTPGGVVDVIVTDKGIAVNPKRRDLLERLEVAGIPVTPIEELQRMAEEICGKESERSTDGRIVAVVEYRDGTVIDVVRQACQ